MKTILAFLSVIFLTLPASAENLHPPNWTPVGNNTETGNKIYPTREMAGPNRVYSREEYNAMQAERRSTGTSWLSSGEKPTISRTGNTTSLKKVIGGKVQNAADSAISGAFNE